MVELIRTDSENADFLKLVELLDAELRVRDGDDHTFYAQFNKPQGLSGVVVAYLEKEPVGCGAIKRYSGDIVEIKRMFVHPEKRGLRIGSAILSELEKWATELGFAECILETGFKQPEAIALYERSGYIVIPNYGQYAEVTSSVCMKKAIADTAIASI
ncbi:MAG: GNAT family N-acetyltransferase [Blastocatellia bacterium]